MLHVVAVVIAGGRGVVAVDVTSASLSRSCTDFLQEH